MKSIILKVTGLAALTALLMYNVQVFESVVESNTSLTALAENNGKSLAESQSGKFCCAENPDNDCTGSPDC